MDGMSLLRWILMLPVSSLVGMIAGGMVMDAGNSLVGEWAFLSAIVVAIGAGVVPIASVVTGLHVAPRANTLVRWILILPLLSMCVRLAGGVLALIRGTTGPLQLPVGVGLSPSVSGHWQYVTYAVGFIAGTFFVVSRKTGRVAH